MYVAVFSCTQASAATASNSFNIFQVSQGANPLLSVSGDGTTTAWANLALGTTQTDKVYVTSTVHGATPLVFEGAM